MDDNGLPFPVFDYMEGNVPPTISRSNTQPLPESFGRNLDTLEKARQWLTNPHNWHLGTLAILKWNGLLCTIRQDHGERLLKEPFDGGLPWCVVTEQRARRQRGEKGEPIDAASPETPVDPEE